MNYISWNLEYINVMMLKNKWSTFKRVLFIVLLSISPLLCKAQTVSVGSGSYSTTLPPGTIGPLTNENTPIEPKVSDSFNLPVRTNTFWSSLIFPFFQNKHSNFIYAHPLNIRAVANGLEMGYTPDYLLVNDDYGYGYSSQLRVSVVGLSTTETLVDDYGEWTVTTLQQNGSVSMKSTFGHGLPYAFFEIDGGNALIVPSSSANIWYNNNGVLGLELAGNFYGIFAPEGSTWSGSGSLQSSLNGQNYLSVAILPDSTSETLELYRKHAYAHVTDSEVSWVYDEATAQMTSTFTYTTELKEDNGSNENSTLSALYRHQWINTTNTLTDLTFNSPRGVMKLHEGNEFSTTMRFSGILPTLPDVGDYDRFQLISYVQSVANENLLIQPTYLNGKYMGRFADLALIADQVGLTAERDHFISEIKTRLEDWFTAGGAQEFSFNSEWNTATGYPSDFGTDRELNDHHFHAGYMVKAAAVVAQFDSAWASQENWGGMVNLIIKDANNWDESDTRFPTLRYHDAYAGHSWASGHADFDNGNNQESSSESINFSSSAIMWGEVTNQPEIRDLGIFLYTSEVEAIEQYWFDVDNEVFPPNYSKVNLGIVWSAIGDYGTWFGNNPEFIHGINILPITGSSFYLGKRPDYIMTNYNAMVAELGGSEPGLWKDIFWQYLALSDADLAISKYNADPNYIPFDGESRAHTMHWLYNMKALGLYSTEVTADTPIYSVFENEGDTTYIAYNAGSIEKLVSFSNGFSMSVPSRSMRSFNRNDLGEGIPQAPEPTVDEDKVLSIFSDAYPSIVNANFNPNDGQSTLASIVSIEGNNTLKFESLDFQNIDLPFPLSVFTRDTVHLDYYTSNATALLVWLKDDQGNEEPFEVAITTDEWNRVEISLDTFSSVDMSEIVQIRFVGNGTVYIDNIFFSGGTSITGAPLTAAPDPAIPQDFVISVFSDSYPTIPIRNYGPDWNQETIPSIVEINGNRTLLYENLNYQGTEFEGAQDVSEMEWFHVDYWTNNSSELRVFLISPGPNSEPYEFEVKINGWQSIDIPLSEFDGGSVDLSDIFQLMFEGNGTVYIDNLYFARTPSLIEAPIPTHPPENVVSLFSNEYDNVLVDTWSAFWDQANVADIQVNGNDVKHYTNHDFSGIEFIEQTIDGTNLEYLHFDMWTPDPTNPPNRFNIKLVDFGADGEWSNGGDDREDELSFDIDNTPDFGSNRWISFDIPIDDFVDMTTREHLAQLLFITNNEIENFYIDNVYFWSNMAVSTEDDDALGIPREVELLQNYPNPFNPTTNIEFRLPATSEVTLTIFNAIGQRVSQLVDARLSAGSYSYTWNATNFSSGIYFYQLKTGSEIITKQMLLIK